MTISIPAELENAVHEAAQARRMSIEDYVVESIKGQIRLEAAMRDELDAWQEVRDEALRLVEDRCQ
jgi:hypothetical protein